MQLFSGGSFCPRGLSPLDYISNVWSYCSPFLSLNFYSRAALGNTERLNVRLHQSNHMTQPRLLNIFKCMTSYLTTFSQSHKAYFASFINTYSCDTCSMYQAHMNIWAFFCRQVLSMKCYWLSGFSLLYRSQGKQDKYWLLEMC